MRARTHIILFLLCVAAVFGFAMLGAVWSFAGFHPGGDVPFDTEAARTSERGMAMFQLYLWPVLAITREFGNSHATMLFAQIHWIILPLVYGGVLHMLLWALIAARRYIFGRKPDVAGPSPTGWE
jgi:hypothetical protein